jgi:hypothetical protein
MMSSNNSIHRTAVGYHYHRRRRAGVPAAAAARRAATAALVGLLAVAHLPVATARQGIWPGEEVAGVAGVAGGVATAHALGRLRQCMAGGATAVAEAAATAAVGARGGS